MLANVSSNIATTRRTTQMLSSTGRLKGEHFHLLADHLLVELDSGNFDLVAAFAEGNVEVQLVSEDGTEEYVALAQSAIYRPSSNRMMLASWTGGRYGAFHPPQGDRTEVEVPTDGTFFKRN